MIKIGITGQAGFIGKHLFNTLGVKKDTFERIEFNRDFFNDNKALDKFVSSCDVIVHLAAKNRHNDPSVIYQTNKELVSSLISSLERTNSTPHVIFSSSTQEERDNLYGKSKKEGRELIEKWAKKSGGTFTGLVIPNVFGPFGHPYYNSVVATFCHQLTHNETPKIDIDGELKLIFVTELVDVIINKIINASKKSTETIHVPHTTQIKVSEILSLLNNYVNQYLKGGVIPELKNKFELDLFNTFRCYMPIETHFPIKFTQHKDPRGAFVELARVNIGGQTSFSTTVSGITRGNHFHTRKVERFAVIKGKALIQLRQIGTNKVFDYYLNGMEPAYVDMPIWYTHNIKNIGDDELYTVFWINEPYDASDPDTYFEDV